MFCRSSREPENKTKKNKLAQCCQSVPGNAVHTCYIYYSSGLPIETPGVKHTLSIKCLHVQQLCHSRLVFSLSLSLSHSFSYRSRNMFHHSLPDRIYSSSTRRVCAYICIKHLAKNMVSDAQHAKLFTSALYKLMIILSLSIFVCAAIINHTLFFL